MENKNLNIDNIEEVEEWCATATSESLFNVMDYILRNKGANLSYYNVRGEIYRRLMDTEKRLAETEDRLEKEMGGA